MSIETNIREYMVELSAASPLFMHRDDIDWRQQVDDWLAEPENRRMAKAGDDRTPAWKWLGYVYHENGYVGVHSDQLMSMLREGASKITVPGRRESFKRQSQSGMLTKDLLWPLTVPAGQIAWAPLHALVKELDFTVHQRVVAQAGFELFLKPAKVGKAKHVRVRPFFKEWGCQGILQVTDPSITEEILRAILFMGGAYCGLGDWRPSSPTKPGPYGRFTATVTEV